MPWPVHPNGLLGAQGDNDTYQISRSLRFNSADSAYLNRTPGSAGDRKKFTISMWVKRGKLGIDSNPIFAWPGGNTLSFQILFNTSNQLEVIANIEGVANQYRLQTTQVFRDTSAWYHLVLASDTSQVTASDRLSVYINGSKITSFGISTYPTIDFENSWNNTVANYIGFNNYFDGYLTEIYNIDGQALTPSSFGETDAVTGRWKAKAYSGTYGANGFYLKFADNSSTAALGTDSSGNGNTWTVNNFVVSPVDGAGNDSLVDSPTNYGNDSGVGGTVRGNYCTLNPLAAGSYVTASNGNLQAIFTSGAAASCIGSTIAVSSGKWYWEITVGAVSSRYPDLGIASSTSNLSTGVTSTNLSTINGKRYSANGDSESGAYGATFTTNDVIGFALNMDSGTLVCYKNNVSQGTNATGLSGSWMPAVAGFNSASFEINFGQRPFAYTAPSGFKALCTTNLSTPTIKKPSSYMDVVTYTGNGGTQTISSLGFSPDLVWVKGRSQVSANHILTDRVRGNGASLMSNNTNAEGTRGATLTSNGFSFTYPDEGGDANFSAATYVAWAWDEAPIAGMDIVSYTGTGANRTIAHNLGVAPKMMIIKNRTSASDGWAIYHSVIGAGKFLVFSTNSETSSVNIWNNTAPTASVFSVGIADDTNRNNGLFIAYLFSEIEGFSKFGSYTGNGSADGPFVYCGFRPRWVMIKQSSTAGNNWQIIDAARSDFNFADKVLFPNTSGAETTANATIDIVSNGFKIRTADGTVNTSSATYIFAAFAEQPFKYARAR
jgi:hypothetical protein